MTPDAFREAGYKLAHCDGSRHCSVLPHIHAKLWAGAEYCAIGEEILLTGEFAYNVTRYMTQNNALELLCSIIADAFIGSHPDWPLRTVVIFVCE